MASDVFFVTDDRGDKNRLIPVYSWVDLASLWAGSVVVSGVFGAALGVLWVTLGLFAAALGPLWVSLGRFGGCFGVL